VLKFCGICELKLLGGWVGELFCCQSCSDLFYLERLDIFRLAFRVGELVKSDCFCRKLSRLLSELIGL
jgi:hypothetical protein